MTIQEYIRIAIAGVPKEDFDYYKEFFTDMSCEHCIYNGFACKSPKVEDVCMDYRDGVGVIVHNHGCTFLVKAGARIAQMTFNKVESPVFEEVDELSESNRDGGFGSTGTK